MKDTMTRKRKRIQLFKIRIVNKGWICSEIYKSAKVCFLSQGREREVSEIY